MLIRWLIRFIDQKKGYLQYWYQGIPMDVDDVRRKSFFRRYSTSTPQLSLFEVQLLSHTGGNPEWAEDKQGYFPRLCAESDTEVTLLLGQLQGGFKSACRITANLSQLSGALERMTGLHGTPYWHLGFEVCIRFGGTELEAYLEWKENVSWFYG